MSKAFPPYLPGEPRGGPLYRTMLEKIEGLREHITWANRYALRHPEEEVLMHAFAASCRARIIELRMGRP